MKVHVLLTGMSGTGKSTLIRELATRGYRAVDTDEGGLSRWVDTRTGLPAPPPAPGAYGWDERDWRWHEERLQDLLDEAQGEVLFVSGTAENQRKFYPQFDLIILLSAPAAVLAARLAGRQDNPYGTTPRSFARVRAHVETVEPRLRQIVDHEIDTRAPVEAVVKQVLALVRSRLDGS